MSVINSHFYQTVHFTGLDKVCNDYPHDGQYVATSRSLKIKYVGESSRRLPSREVMKLIVTSFHEGKYVILRCIA